MRVRRLPMALSILVPALLCVGLVQPAGAGGATNGLITWTRPVGLFHDAEVWVLRPDGSGNHQFTHNLQNDFDPAWSPDGTYLAFASSGNDVDIWLMRTTRRGQINLTNNPDAPDLGPSWSPDGSEIAFWRQNFDGTGSIWVMQADGSNPVQLTDDDAANMQPAWSPDGTTILFVSDRDGNLELYRIDPDGQNEARLTFTEAFHEENPEWAPDGSKIAFDACEAPSYPCPGNAPFDVFSMNADTSGLTRLTDDVGIDFHPAWSPDGTKIAFRCDRPFTAICLMNADGSDEQILTPGEFWGGSDPDWQPAI